MGSADNQRSLTTLFYLELWNYVWFAFVNASSGIKRETKGVVNGIVLSVADDFAKDPPWGLSWFCGEA